MRRQTSAQPGAQLDLFHPFPKTRTTDRTVGHRPQRNRRVPLRSRCAAMAVIDAILQGTHYDGETGYPIPLSLRPGFVLEPQAQIIWQHVGLREENDGLGSVDPGSTSGVLGRLGARGAWTIKGANGQVWQP